MIGHNLLGDAGDIGDQQVAQLQMCIRDSYKYCVNELGVKGTTVVRYHANIHTALKYAVRHDLIKANPMEKVDRPKSQHFTGSFYSV